MDEKTMLFLKSTALPNIDCHFSDDLSPPEAFAIFQTLTAKLLYYSTESNEFDVPALCKIQGYSERTA